METYFPTAKDGNVHFFEGGVGQEVTQDGLSIDSGVAEMLVEQGTLKHGKATKATKSRATLPDDVVLTADGVPVVDDYNPADASAPNAPATPLEADAAGKAQSDSDPADHKPTPQGD